MSFDPIKYVTDYLGRWGIGLGTTRSAADVDNNFWNVDSRLQIVEAWIADPTVNVISSVTVSGNTFSIHMEDGTVFGPFTMPAPTFRYRSDLSSGVWTASSSYLAADLFREGGALYMVNLNHTSGTSFNPSATDGGGHPLYSLLIPALPLAVDDLTDVTLGGTPLADGDFFVWNDAAGYWWNQPKDGYLALNELSGVVITTPTAGQLIGYDGVDWINKDPATASDIEFTASTSDLVSTNVNDAIEELWGEVPSLTGYATETFVNSAILGVREKWIPASDMTPRVTNGADFSITEMTTSLIVLKTLNFDANTQEYAQFHVVMPKSWNEGTITFIPYWLHGTASTNFGVSWRLDYANYSNTDDLTSVASTGQLSVDDGGVDNTLYIGPESSGINVASTYGLNDMTTFIITRVVADAGDTLAVDAKLIGIKLKYTMDAATDS